MAKLTLETDSVEMQLEFKPEHEWAIVGIVNRLMEEVGSLTQLMSAGLVKVTVVKNGGG